MSSRMLAVAGAVLVVAVIGGVAMLGTSSGTENVADNARQAPVYEVDPSWPRIPNDWVFGLTSGLAVDGQGHIWVLHRPRTVQPEDLSRAAPPVLEFAADGSFVQGWGGPGEGYEWPNTEHGIFVDHNDNVWIAGSGSGDDQVLKFTRDGNFLMQIGRAGQSKGNTDTENLNRPADVYVYPATNELFVADGYGNRRVIVFDAETGEFKRMWGAFGEPPTDPPAESAGGQERSSVPPSESNPRDFNLVHGVRVSNDGVVYVSDRSSMRLQVFNLDGGFVRQEFFGRTEPDPEVMAARAGETAFGAPIQEIIEEVASARQSVSRTAFSPDPEQRYLFVAERSNQQILVLDRETLEPLTAFGRPGDKPGEFFILHDMVTDHDGNLYTAEVNVGARAQKFNLIGMAPLAPD
jgi:DNA-binding beta-propeller fold protein YncE